MDQKNKSKLIDGALVYMFCLLVTGLCCSLLLDRIGAFAVILAAAIDAAVVIAATKVSRIKTFAIFRYKKCAARASVASALVYGAAILLALPTVLFGELLVPSFAAAAFRLSNYMTLSELWQLPIMLFAVAYAYALLFEGYLYTRARSLGKDWLALLLTAAVAGLFRLDLYLILPIALLEAATVVARKWTDSLIMPTALQFFTAVFALGLTEIASIASKFETTAAAEMGVAQVCGLSLICVAAAISTILAALGIRGELKSMSARVKLCLVISAVVTLAVGCAVAGVG